MPQPKRSAVLLAAMQIQLNDAVRQDAREMLTAQTPDAPTLLEIATFLKGGAKAMRKLSQAHLDVAENTPLI